MTFREWLDNQIERRAQRISEGKASFINRGMLFDELVLNDGTELSVQASVVHRSIPEETLIEPGSYSAVEVYTHGEEIEDFKILGETNEFIYNYIHVDFMEDVVKNHGGIKES